MRCKCVYVSMLMLAAVVAASGTAQGQEMFTGIVVDSATLAALPAVSVQLKNTFRGTTTDEQGHFSIQATRNDTLIFTLVGYERLDLPLATYESGMIRLSEKYTLLEAVTIDEYRRDLYEGMFDEQNSRLRPQIPFYLSKAKKEKIRLGALRSENQRVQTYVEVVITDPQFKTTMMAQYGMTEREYYNVLRAFNERHYEVMYYLTRAELISMLNTFFESQARR